MKRFCVLVLFVLVPVLSSIAQGRGAIIIHAEYGTGNSWVDVTQRVRSLVRGSVLNFRVDNNTLGVDPRSGQRKTLRLDVRERNRTQQLMFREGEYVTLRGYSPLGDFQIIRGDYGTGNRTMDVTRQLNSQVQGEQLRLRVSNETMGGDPARGQRKALTVRYRYNGRPAQVTVYEGDFLNLPGGSNDGGYNNNRGLQITRAQYGVGNRLMDVTNRLNSQVQRGQLRLEVSNQAFGGDPAPNQRKTLSVWYTNDGRPGQVVVNEGDYLDLPGGNGNNNRGLQITRAQYGAGTRLMDVSNRLNSQIQRGQLSLQISNQAMGGDPAPGQRKALAIWYTYNGRPGQALVNEGDYLNLPAPEELQRSY